MLRKLFKIISKFCLRKAGITDTVACALLVSDPSVIGAGIGAVGSLIGGSKASSGAKKAAKTASEAQDRAAELQRQTALDALEFSREQFDYGIEQDLFNRAMQERNFRTGLGAYADQRDLARIGQEGQRQQLNYENQLRQHALGQLQPYANLGIGALGSLPQMVNATPHIGGNLYGLAGQAPRVASNFPTFDYAAARGNTFDVQAPGMLPALGASQLPEYEGIDPIEDFVRSQLEERVAKSTAETAEDVLDDPDPVEDPGKVVKWKMPDNISNLPADSRNTIERLIQAANHLEETGQMTQEFRIQIMRRLGRLKDPTRQK